jgi:hypothetical protein
MKSEIILIHKFIDVIPRELEPNTIYVSIKFCTAIHSCCCGCGNQVVTPLSPIDWKLIFNGRSISLEPSIGNWSFPCRSHYWIRNNVAVWSSDWANDKIEAGRKKTEQATTEFFKGKNEEKPKTHDAPNEKKPRKKAKRGFWF